MTDTTSSTTPATAKIEAAGLSLDIALCTAIAVFAGLLAWVLFARLSFTITHLDVWFDSDSNFVYQAVTDRWNTHQGRNHLHPLFSLMTFPVIFFQSRMLGLSEYHAVRVLVSLSASLWAALIYVTLRLLNRPPGGALIFTGIAMASTGGLFLVPIIERFTLASISSIACVATFAAYRRRIVSENWLIGAAALSLGFTVTNFMVGATALWLALGFRKGLQGAINAFFVVTMLASVAQNYVFPKSTVFLKLYDILDATHMPIAGSTADKSIAFLLHSVVMPKPIVEVKPHEPHEAAMATKYMSVQRAGLTNHEPIGLIAALLWLSILGMGAIKCFRSRPLDKADVLLGLVCVGQFGLHLVFGSESILYALNYMPLILFIASKSLIGPNRYWTYGLSLSFLALLLWNNWHIFMYSEALALSLIDQVTQ